MNDGLETRLARLEQELGELRDREAIREVIYTYCRGADRCDLDLIKSCYHANATDDHGFMGGAATEVMTYAIEALRRIDSSMHAICNILIELKGNRAFVESYLIAVHRLESAEGFNDYYHRCRYLDIFEKRDGVWKILRRTGTDDGMHIVRAPDLRKLAPELAAAVDAGAGLMPGKRAPQDAVYLGFDLPTIMKVRPGLPDLWKHYDVFDAS